MKRWPKETRDVLAVLALGAGAALGPFTSSSDGAAAWHTQQQDVLPSSERAPGAAAIPGRAARAVRESLGVCLQAEPVPAPMGYTLVEAGTGAAVDRWSTLALICDGWGDPLGVLHADAHGRSELPNRHAQAVRRATRVPS